MVAMPDRLGCSTSNMPTVADGLWIKKANLRYWTPVVGMWIRGRQGYRWFPP
jgi:hypothetical protein